jgi:hypothetical protein
VLPEELDALLAGAGRVHDDGVEGAAARRGDRHVVFDVDSAEIPEAAYPGGKSVGHTFGQIHTVCFRNLLDLDPDPLVRCMDPDPSIIKQKL